MKCPYCKVVNEQDIELVFERPKSITNQTIDKWDRGAYYCTECGLAGPKNVIERLAFIIYLAEPLYKEKVNEYR
jgi:hypothetical protein